MRKFRITVEGRSYNVVVEDLGAEIADPPRVAPIAAPAPTAAAAPPAAAPSAPPAAAAGAGSVVAPLGGVVDSIDVALGSVVAIGDKVATIEAMKMKNEVRSHFAGKVTHIAVTVNQGVETGAVLMTIA